MIDFNINNYVHVQLTDQGINELERQHNELQAHAPSIGDFTPPVTDSEGWSKWQLHSLMYRLGHCCALTGKPPFEIEIRIPAKEV